jgi:hypothetical protein
MRNRLPLVLSIVAVAIAVLGFTPLAEGVKQQLVPANSVGAAQLKTNAVRTVKIKNRQVTEEKIVLGAITSDLLRDGAVGAEKIEDGAVTPEKLAQTAAAGVFNSANIAIPSGTSVALAFNNERFDVGEVHDPGSTRLRAPAAGVYVVAGNLNFAGSSNVGQRRAEIRKNGEVVVASVQVESTSSNQTHLVITKVIQLAAGDYLELLAFQNSGGDLAVLQEGQFSPDFNIAWVGAGPGGA